MALRRTALARGFSPSVRGRGATCFLWYLTPNRRPRVKRAQAGLRALSLGRTLSTRAFCAHAPAALVVAGRYPMKGAAPARGRSASVHGRGATCQLYHLAPNRRPRIKRAQAAYARSLCRRGSAHGLAARARRAAGVVGGPCPMKGAAPARGRSPSVHGRSATCQLRPLMPDRRTRVKRAQGGGALAVSGEDAQHTSFLRARAASCWLNCGPCPVKGATPAKGRSPSVHGRGATYQLWHLTPNRRPRVKRAHAA